MQVILNFKTYKEATGNKAEELIHTCNRLKISDIIACVQTADLFKLSMIARFPLFVQHIDPIEPGRNTGFVSAEAVMANGASGCLINHSEHRLKFQELKSIVARCRANGLHTIVCTSSLPEARKIIGLGVDYIAYEDPRLIATGIPVTSKPAYVKRFLVALKKINEFDTKFICGAGISKKEDVIKARELGYDGVLIASAFVLSKDPQSFLESITGESKML